jgi:hypothetical protein
MSDPTRLSQQRSAEAWRSLAESILCAQDFAPCATGDLWHDALEGRPLPFAHAFDRARAVAAAASPADPCNALLRAIVATEEAVLRAAGWTPVVGALFVWRAPDADGTPRTRIEAAAFVMRAAMELE